MFDQKGRALQADLGFEISSSSLLSFATGKAATASSSVSSGTTATGSA